MESLSNSIARIITSRISSLTNFLLRITHLLSVLPMNPTLVLRQRQTRLNDRRGSSMEISPESKQNKRQVFFLFFFIALQQNTHTGNNKTQHRRANKKRRILVKWGTLACLEPCFGLYKWVRVIQISRATQDHGCLELCCAVGCFRTVWREIPLNLHFFNSAAVPSQVDICAVSGRLIDD